MSIFQVYCPFKGDNGETLYSRAFDILAGVGKNPPVKFLIYKILS